jgi:hypothetical protein
MFRRTLVLLSLVFFVSIATAEEPDSYFGFTLDALAESFARLTTFRSEVGQANADAKFEEWLRGRKQTRKTYEAAYAAWWERFGADKSGQLEARFHRIHSEYAQRLNFGDAPDQRQQAKEGITLDRYAQAIVAMTRRNWPVDKVVKEFGFKNEAHFDRVNEAWIAAMRDDKTFTVTQQYAALYQKYAGQDFAREQEATMAKALADARSQAVSETAQERTAPPTIEDYAKELESKVPRERWSAAHMYANQCAIWLPRRNAKDPRAQYCSSAALKSKVLPVLLDAIDHFDDETVGSASGAADDIADLKLVNGEVKLAVQRALNRITARLDVLSSAWTPIQHKAVPERATLRIKIDQYENEQRLLQQTLDRW